MYQALALGVENQTLQASLNKIDKFISVAPCLYSGPEIESNQRGATRTDTKNRIRSVQDTGLDYIFGG